VPVRSRETQGHLGSRRINQVTVKGTLGNLVKCLEVLAGAIPWGFKSPSPHQILTTAGSFRGKLVSHEEKVAAHRTLSGE
jgi:hypothetical protein